MFEGFQRRRVRTSEAEINLVTGGSGPALLLLHGYPETHVMWHRCAGQLAQHFTVVIPDLRGYGDSAKPAGSASHAEYSKRAMAKDQAEVMTTLGHESFYLAGHDRGARVSHRLALDHALRVRKIAVLDIVPTLKVFDTVNQLVATSYFHWFFLIQPAPFPEKLIGADPDYYLTSRLGSWGSNAEVFDPTALQEYLRCFRDPACIHSTCEDYRAAASIDLEHDRADLERKISMPLLALWGAKGLVHKAYDVLAVWRERASNVRGLAVDCGHFIPEEKPQETYELLRDFFLQT